MPEVLFQLTILLAEIKLIQTEVKVLKRQHRLIQLVLKMLTFEHSEEVPDQASSLNYYRFQ
jgi:hypothetical protein